MRKILLLITVVTGVAFTQFVLPDEPVPIPPSKQRLGGDPKKGFEYLTTGDYVKGGIPYNFFLLGTGGSSKVTKTIYLQREGLNQNIPHEYTAVKASNGEVLVAPNCLQCHAQVLDGKLFIGLGNSFSDFTMFQRLNPKMLEQAEAFLKKTKPAQYEAAAPFLTVTKTIGQYLNTPVRGVNPADRLAAVLAAHRDPKTFKWSDKPLLDIPKEVVATDVPAWWLLKKKNAMFYNGFGRGDFGRFLMASNLLTVTDTTESAEVDSHMPDVLAYIYSLEPPAYPYAVDKLLAAKGKVLFEKNCSKCHGSYGQNETYPNLLIPGSIIKTDSLLYQSNYSTSQFLDWFNSSWFTTGDHPARLEPFRGYIAPPLDGIWVTAPYLHNGSVPTLEAMLNSKIRPRYWSRDFDKPEFDPVKGGWKYTAHDKPGGTVIYNTDLPGYGNYGHYFGDKLSAEERKAIIEYLKTL
jgi:mono/diheme cytochrome c family protein